jgi:hypothetical protein
VIITEFAIHLILTPELFVARIKGAREPIITIFHLILTPELFVARIKGAREPIITLFICGATHTRRARGLDTRELRPLTTGRSIRGNAPRSVTSVHIGRTHQTVHAWVGTSRAHTALAGQRAVVREPPFIDLTVAIVIESVTDLRENRRGQLMGALAGG